MGGISRMHLSRYKALLQLSDEALELADRHDIDEKKLRYVTGMPTDTHTEIVRQIISFHLTSKQVQELCSGEDPSSDDPPEKLPAKAVKMARTLHSANEASAQDVARALLQEEHDVHLARARIRSVVDLLNEVERLLEKEGM